LARVTFNESERRRSSHRRRSAGRFRRLNMRSGGPATSYLSMKVPGRLPLEHRSRLGVDVIDVNAFFR
jgi:hypothetical protein